MTAGHPLVIRAAMHGGGCRSFLAGRAHAAVPVESSIGLVTALNPYIGYTAATDTAKEALVTGRGVAELLLEKGLLPAGRLADLLRPEVVAGTGSHLV